MSENKWHRSNAALGSILAALGVFCVFSVIALDGPLRLVLGGAMIIGIVVTVWRIGQNRQLARGAG